MPDITKGSPENRRTTSEIIEDVRSRPGPFRMTQEEADEHWEASIRWSVDDLLAAMRRREIEREVEVCLRMMEHHGGEEASLAAGIRAAGDEEWPA